MGTCSSTCIITHRLFRPAQFLYSHAFMGSESLRSWEGTLWRLISANPSQRIQIWNDQRVFDLRKMHVKVDFSSEIGWITTFIARMTNEMFNSILKNRITATNRAYIYCKKNYSWNQSIPRYFAWFWTKMPCPWRHSFWNCSWAPTTNLKMSMDN